MSDEQWTRPTKSGITTSMALAAEVCAQVKDYREDGNLYNPEEVAQDVVNAAWVPFDANDEKTWPKNGVFMVIDGGRANEGPAALIPYPLRFQRVDDGYMKIILMEWENVTCYADPHHIMPENFK